MANLRGFFFGGGGEGALCILGAKSPRAPVYVFPAVACVNMIFVQSLILQVIDIWNYCSIHDLPACVNMSLLIIFSYGLKLMCVNKMFQHHINSM